MEMNKQKKVVEYVGEPVRLELLKSAILQGTVDHPDLSNRVGENVVITSQVVKIEPDGSFETLNTRYVPSKHHFLLG